MLVKVLNLPIFLRILESVTHIHNLLKSALQHARDSVLSVLSDGKTLEGRGTQTLCALHKPLQDAVSLTLCPLYRKESASLRLRESTDKLPSRFRLAVPEALNAIRKAEKILLVHCGPESAEVRELREMRSCLLGSPFVPAGPLA